MKKSKLRYLIKKIILKEIEKVPDTRPPGPVAPSEPTDPSILADPLPEPKLILGCTNPNDVNYNPEADEDTNPTSCSGIHRPDIKQGKVGCMDQNAQNYDSEAQVMCDESNYDGDILNDIGKPPCCEYLIDKPEDLERLPTDPSDKFIEKEKICVEWSGACNFGEIGECNFDCDLVTLEW